MSSPLLQSDCPALKLIARGKVRDLYEVDATSLLFVATDRVSAFDVVMKNGIPDKGKILTQLSVFWFGLLADVLPSHLITADIDAMPPSVQQYRGQLAGRSLLVRKLTILPIEAIVRGYITGSGWAEYQRKGTVSDIPLPAGLQQCQALATPLFTPSTKAEIGQHDENIHPDKVKEMIGAELTDKVAATAIALYQKAASYARERGIIIVDTKFEFGIDAQGQLTIADEVLTPDSSRFWPLDAYAVGREQESFDKQFVRNYLLDNNFDKQTSVALPDHVIRDTLSKYIDVYTRLTGQQPEL
ncbi:phosphoribosylaminoimidazole-succinocarboxamide synthase [Syncephalis pseudoplumigaleata]|uniref:Phosphoribosylaminoimidazole-succinocarboxamide synthase n=1 Tax=Syncephalis pseudoplumigaleata TaxID=1712513 RepID=A0A4V1J2A0_9FUNG|nr:phosphoribosylaminoimidazole-succinocarboxamide synthase [Syncephalis pseudoplumigaleata]|eukprot:RKP27829.1 phosphoribosylaminoimidazole-succinocarboxamide synthase [Syncephalis pseudoplumigaleata]